MIAGENFQFNENDSTKSLKGIEFLAADIGKQLEADKFTGIIGLAPQNDPNN